MLQCRLVLTYMLSIVHVLNIVLRVIRMKRRPIRCGLDLCMRPFACDMFGSNRFPVNGPSFVQLPSTIIKLTLPKHQ